MGMWRSPTRAPGRFPSEVGIVMTVAVATLSVAACSSGEVVVLDSVSVPAVTSSAGPSLDAPSASSSTSELQPDQPSVVDSPSPSSERRSEAYYLDEILQYCDERTPGLCLTECETISSNPGLNTISLTLADVNVDMMVMYGNITREEAAEYRPYWVKFWELYC